MTIRTFTHGIHYVLGYISNTKIAGVIPLDIVMHLTISYTLMIILLLRKVRFIYAYLLVLFLAIGKEVFDSFSLTNTISENFKDLVVSMIFPTILMIVWKLKRKRIT